VSFVVIMLLNPKFRHRHSHPDTYLQGPERGFQNLKNTQNLNIIKMIRRITLERALRLAMLFETAMKFWISFNSFKASQIYQPPAYLYLVWSPGYECQGDTD